jgi:hypothetical protein
MRSFDPPSKPLFFNSDSALEVLQGAEDAEISDAVAMLSTEPPTPAIIALPPVSEVEEWFVASEGQQFGPMTAARVHELRAAGDLESSALCWREGFKDWEPLWSVAELAPSLLESPAPQELEAEPQTPRMHLTGSALSRLAEEELGALAHRLPTVPDQDAVPALNPAAWLPSRVPTPVVVMVSVGTTLVLALVGFLAFLVWRPVPMLVRVVPVAASPAPAASHPVAAPATPKPIVLARPAAAHGPASPPAAVQPSAPQPLNDEADQAPVKLPQAAAPQ